MLKFSDRDIVLQLRSGDREKVVQHLYQTSFPKIRSYIVSRGGSREDARDVFQDTVMVFFRKVTDGLISEEGMNVPAYLMNMAKNRWIDKIRRDQKIQYTDEYYPFDDRSNNDVQEHTLDKERSAIIDQVLDSLGERCSELLRLVIFYDMSMKEIADKMKFSGEDSAKTQHYKCRQKLIQQYRDNKVLKQLLSKQDEH